MSLLSKCTSFSQRALELLTYMQHLAATETTGNRTPCILNLLSNQTIKVSQCLTYAAYLPDYNDYKQPYIVKDSDS